MPSLGQSSTSYPKWDCIKCCARALLAGALSVSDFKSLARPHYQHQSEMSSEKSPSFSTKLCSILHSCCSGFCWCTLPQGKVKGRSNISQGFDWQPLFASCLSSPFRKEKGQCKLPHIPETSWAGLFLCKVMGVGIGEWWERAGPPTSVPHLMF